MTSDETLLEKVTYTASLASRPQDIDPILDPVRIMTARKQTAEGFTPEERTTLNAVEMQLEQYLVEREPLRSFEPKTLQLQIEQHLTGGRGHRRNKIYLALVICLPIVAVFLLNLLPFSRDNSAQRMQLLVSVAFSLFHVGAVSLFLIALPAFKTQLRRSFITFCIGLILLALTFSILPILTVLNVNVHFPGVPVMVSRNLLLIASIIMYLGMRRYAKLVGVSGVTISPLLILAMALPITAVSLLQSGTAGGLPEWAFDIAGIENGMYGGMALLGCLMLNELTKHIADIYKPSMRALTLAIMFGAIASFYSYAMHVTVGLTPPGISATVGGVLIAIMGIFLARAGYLFNKVSYY